MGLFDRIGEWADTGSESVKRITTGDISGITNIFASPRFVFWFKLIRNTAIVLFVGILIYKFFFQYKYKVLVKKLKGTAVIDHYFTRAKETKDIRGKTKLTIFRNRKTCSIPSYKITSKMGKSDFFTLYEDENGELHPFPETQVCILPEILNEIKEYGKELIDPQVMRAWRLDEIKAMEMKYKQKNFFMEHLPEFIVFITAVSCIALIWITSKMIQNAYVQNAAAFMEVARNCLGG